MSADELLAEVLAAIGTYDPLMFSDQHRELFARAATTGARAAGGEGWSQEKLLDYLDAAHGLICNAHRARVDYVTEADGASPGWAEAARRWIDAYPPPKPAAPPPPPPPPVAHGVAELLAICEERQKSAFVAVVSCDEIVRLLTPGGGQS